MVRDDSIITLGCIIRTVGKTGSAEGGNFCLEDLDIGWISGCTTRTGTKGTRVDSLLLLRIVDHPFGPNTEECCEVSFIEKDFEVASFFWNGSCHN